MNNKNHIFVLLIFLNCFIFFYGTYTNLRINLGESILYTISKPFLLINNYISQFSDNIKMNLKTRVELEKSLKKLSKENRLLKEKIRVFKILEDENLRLKKFFSIDSRNSYRKIFAKVIGGSNSLYQSIIIIDKGKSSNIKNGLGVVNYEGVVGIVIKTFTTSSKVLLLTDPRFKVDVELLTSHEHGILVGNNKNCLVKYLPINKTYQHGEMVVTSGFNGVFPKGIPIGYIDKIIDNNLYKTAVIEPFLKKYSLDFVSIIEENCK